MARSRAVLPEMPQEEMLRVVGPAFGWSGAFLAAALAAGVPKPAAEVKAAQAAALQAAQRARRDYPLLRFVEEAWDFIEPQAYVPGWHIEAYALHLQAITETALATDDCPVPSWTVPLRNLLINVPPRASKSLITSVLWQPWVWLTAPSTRWMFVSYASDLALRDATYSRTLMQTGWYQALLAAYTPWKFTTDQNVKGFFANTAMGYRISTSVGGKATGFGGDIIVGDDLHSTSEDFSTTRAEIQAAKQFWSVTMATRQTNAKRTCRVLVGQRVALDDVSGEVLKRGDYAHLCLPMEYEPAQAKAATPLGWIDPRTQEGELLCPDRFSEAEIADYKRSLGHRYYAQYQQRPSTELSSIFPRTRWRFFHTWPELDWLDVLIQSWDFRFGDKKEEGSYVAGHVWGRKGPPETGQVFLLDRVFARLSFDESVDEMGRLAAKWPGAYAKLIEQKANGEAIYSTLRSKVFGLVLVPVGGKYSSKEARAQAEALLQKEGRAWLPHPTLAPWVDQYIEHMENFPGEPTDDTDATSQAWHHLCPRKPAEDTMRAEARKRAEYQAKLQAALRQQRRSRTGTGV